MKILSYIVGLSLIALCAVWSYRVNYATRAAEKRLARLEAAVATEREALGVLKAEWAYLNRPDRLWALVQAHQAALQLTPLDPGQFGEAAMVAYPPHPDPLLDLTAGEPP